MLATAPAAEVPAPVSARDRATRALANATLYHHQATPSWRGVPVDKCASDLLVYQEIISARQPAIIIETGAWYGGSALFLADMCMLNGIGRVMSIDLDPPKTIQHPCLTFLRGDSVAQGTLDRVWEWAQGAQGLVILDSAHDQAHVLAELDAYSPFVAASNFLIVEDTNVNAHPVRPDFGPGPWEAVQEWLPGHLSFVQDHAVEPYLTFAPGGYLRRVC